MPNSTRSHTLATSQYFALYLPSLRLSEGGTSEQGYAHMLCYSNVLTQSSTSAGFEEWPEVNIVPSGSPIASAPQEMDEEELPLPPISPIDMINSSSGSITLVSRMQALHGLANRRRHPDGRRRPSLSRTTFFSEPSIVPSLRRERLVNAKVSGKQRESVHGRRLSTGSIPLLAPVSGAGPSVLDLRGLLHEGGPRSSARASGSGAYASSPTFANSHARLLVPSSPASDSSGSQHTHSPLSVTGHNNDELSSAEPGCAAGFPYTPGAVAGGSADTPSRMGEIFGSTLNGVSTHAANDAPLPISPIAYQAPIAAGPLTTASTYAAYASNQPMASLPAYTASTAAASYGYASNDLAGDAGVPLASSTAVDSRTPPSPPRASTMPSMTESVSTIDSNVELDYVPASAPPDARGQVPFVFDPAYEAESAHRLRSLLVTMSEVGPEEKQQATVRQGPPHSHRRTPLLGPRHATSSDVHTVSNVIRGSERPYICVADFSLRSRVPKSGSMNATPAHSTCLRVYIAISREGCNSLFRFA